MRAVVQVSKCPGAVSGRCPGGVRAVSGRCPGGVRAVSKGGVQDRSKRCPGGWSRCASVGKFQQYALTVYCVLLHFCPFFFEEYARGAQECRCVSVQVPRCPGVQVSMCPGVLWPFWLTSFISVTFSLLFGARWVSFWKPVCVPSQPCTVECDGSPMHGGVRWKSEMDVTMSSAARDHHQSVGPRRTTVSRHVVSRSKEEGGDGDQDHQCACSRGSLM